jgi:hypothetical protein
MATIDTTPSTVATNALQAIPFSSLIGGPLDACIQAQALAAKTTYEFIQQVGLYEDPVTREKKTVTVVFQYQKGNRMVNLVVPLLAIVPIPYIAVNNITIDFIAKISAEASTVSTTSEMTSYGGEVAAGLRAGGRMWGLNIDFKANYSSKKDSTATAQSRYSVEYTMTVHVAAGQDSLPAGLAAVLNILQEGIVSTNADGRLVLTTNSLALDANAPARAGLVSASAEGPDAITIKNQKIRFELPSNSGLVLSLVTGTGPDTGQNIEVTADDTGVAAVNVNVERPDQFSSTVPPIIMTVITRIPMRDSQGTIVRFVEQSDAVTISVAKKIPPAPLVTKVEPPTGPDGKQTFVTITGDKFGAGARVTFGGTPATAVVRVSETSITCKTPEHDPGQVDVVVTNPDNQVGILSGGFTYQPVAPNPTAINPQSGAVGGNTRVTISGNDFLRGAIVTFGGSNANNVSVSSDGATLTCDTPPHDAGEVEVKVINPNRQGKALSDKFTYKVPPSDAELTDEERIGAEPSVPTASERGAETGVTEDVDVSAVGPRRRSRLRIHSVTPEGGPVSGGTQARINGSGFQPGAAVAFQGAAATNVVVVNDNTITCIAPPNNAGWVTVAVTNPDNHVDRLADGFLYE